MDELIQQLMDVFAVEAREHLEVVEDGLVRLEQRPSDLALAREIFRGAHTLKGDASCIAADAVVALAHAAENLMSRVAGGEMAPASDVISLLLATVDRLRFHVERAIEGDDRLEPEDESLIEALGAAQCTALAGLAPERTLDDRRGDAARRTVRVGLDRLDAMLDLTGEIMIARGRIMQMLAAGESPQQILEAFCDSDPIYAGLQESVTRARMVPVGPLLRQFARAVRDVATAHSKAAQLVLDGEDVELDARAVEELREPLMHLVRNAIDHGLEARDERTARGKNPSGRIALTAAHDAGMVVITVTDDGRGIDREQVRRKAIAHGLFERDSEVSDAALHELLFAPGFSTAESVTDLSGRGVGLDIVRRSIEKLRGTIEVASSPGVGTTFTIRLPLTLAIIDGFGVRIGGETYIVPLSAVLECIELPADGGDGRTGMLDLRGTPVPYIRLREVFALAAPRAGREHAVVVRPGAIVAALAVDELLGAMQVVIKPLSRFCRTHAVTGSAVLGSGRVALILDVATLVEDASASIPAECAAAPAVQN